MASPTLSAGHIFISRLGYLRKKGGAELVDRVLARLSAADQIVLKGMILPITWLPLSLNERLDQAIAEELAALGDRTRVFIEMGEASAEEKLTGHHKIFAAGKGPHHLLGSLPQNHRLNCSQGRMTYEKLTEHSGVGKMFDSGYTTPYTCLTNVGWLRRAILLTGGQSPTVTDPLCVSRGDPHCEYHCRWL